MNTYVRIFRGLDACGGRKLRTDTHTHTHTTRGVEIQCQWHQLSGAKSELGTTGLVIGNLLLSTLLKIIIYMKFNEHIKE